MTGPLPGDAEPPGGTFHVKINGTVLPETLGTNGADWAWQKAGVISLEQGPATIVLHDLTGFNGRCDALYLTSDPAEAPPERTRLARPVPQGRRRDRVHG